MTPSHCPSGQWVRVCPLDRRAAATAGAGPLFETPAAPTPHSATPPAQAQARGKRAARITTGLRLDADVHERLRKMAFHEDTSIQLLLENAVELLFQSRQQRR